MAKPETTVLPVPAAAPARKPLRWDRFLHFPAVIYLIITTQVPFLAAVWLSLHAWNLMIPANGVPFIGLDNYIYDLFHDSTFWSALLTTIVLTTGSLVLALLVGSIFALLLNRRLPGRAICRMLVIIPFLVTPAVSATLWKDSLLNPVYGLVNYVLGQLGVPRIAWLDQQPLLSIIVMTTWQWAPFMFLIVLSGLQALSDETLEASALDGASYWQTLLYVVLPQLQRYYQVAILLGAIFILQTFDNIYIATGGGPGISTTNLTYYVYRVAFVDFQVGGAASLGVLSVFVAFGIAWGILRVFSQLIEE